MSRLMRYSTSVNARFTWKTYGNRSITIGWTAVVFSFTKQGTQTIGWESSITVYVPEKKKSASCFTGCANCWGRFSTIKFCGLGSRVSVQVVGSVNSNHNPNHIYNPSHIYNRNLSLTIILTIICVDCQKRSQSGECSKPPDLQWAILHWI